jgi:hypothetical protein
MWLTALTRLFLLFISLVVGGEYQAYASNLIVANVVISNTDQSSAAASQHNPSPETIAEEAPLPSSPETEPTDSTKTAEPAADAAEVPAPKVNALKRTPIKGYAPLKYNLNSKAQLNSKGDHKPRQYELHGYVNNKYVYLIVEKAKANGQQVVGYMFDGKGKKKYVYGEWVNKTLQIYEPSSKKSTVLLNDSPNQSTTGSLFGNEKQFIEHSDAVK